MKYAVIVCPGHSGSTLLAMCLNSHEDVAVFGEFASVKHRIDLLREGGSADSICSFCYGNCTFFDEAEWKWLYRCHYSRYGRILKIKRLLTMPLYARHLLEKTGAQVIGDSSKSIEWALGLYKSHSWIFDFTFLFLTRNPKAVIASHLRKGKDLDVTVSKYRQSVRKMLEFKRLLEGRYGGEKSVEVNYENFVQDPGSALARICKCLDLDYKDDMLDYDQKEHHIVGGNDTARSRAKRNRGQKIVDKPHIARFLNSDSNFVLDERWVDELTGSQKKSIDEKLRQEMEQLGY